MFLDSPDRVLALGQLWMNPPFYYSSANARGYSCPFINIDHPDLPNRIS